MVNISRKDRRNLINFKEIYLKPDRSKSLNCCDFMEQKPNDKTKENTHTHTINKTKSNTNNNKNPVY